MALASMLAILSSGCHKDVTVGRGTKQASGLAAVTNSHRPTDASQLTNLVKATNALRWTNEITWTSVFARLYWSVQRWSMTAALLTGGEETNYYFMDGEVRFPGCKPIPGPHIPLAEAIASAGGFTDFADQERVVLRRHDRTTVPVNYTAIPEESRNKIEIAGGDSVEVPRRSPFKRRARANQ